LGDISQLKAGGDLVLKVYFRGSPYAGPGTWDATYNGYSTEAEDNFYSKTKVSGDMLRIPIPRPGRWFVRYWIKTDAVGADMEKYNQEKQTSTLVFQIPNGPKRTKE